MRRLRDAVLASAGPLAFGAAARISGRRLDGYSPADEPISALAALDSPTASTMLGGFLALTAGTLALSARVRGGALPPAVPRMMALAGATVAGAGIARNSTRSCPTRGVPNPTADPVTPSDDLHAAFSGATFALWMAMPLTTALRGRDLSPGIRALSLALGLATVGSFVAVGALSQRPDGYGGGTAQRVMVGSALAWFPVAALAAHPARSR